MFENLDQVKTVFDFDDPTVYAIPLFVLMIGIELFIDIRRSLKLYHRKDAISSIGMGLGSLVIGLGMKTLAFIAFNYRSSCSAVGSSFSFINFKKHRFFRFDRFLKYLPAFISNYESPITIKLSAESGSISPSCYHSCMKVSFFHFGTL